MTPELIGTVAIRWFSAALMVMVMLTAVVRCGILLASWTRDTYRKHFPSTSCVQQHALRSAEQ